MSNDSAHGDATKVAPPQGPLDPRLERSAKLRLYLMVRRVVDSSRMVEFRNAHLTWMLAQEQAGRIFLSGPVTQLEDDVPLNGLTVIRASDAAEARRIGDEEPYVVEGVMTYGLCEWTVFEGSLPLMLTLSDSTVRL